MKQIFIDKFTVPKNVYEEFVQRMNSNRNFLRTISGFVEDTAYERTDENGAVIVITVAVWDSREALENAKKAVQVEYKKIGFNPAEMLARLNITMDRGTYKEIAM
jgi:heme-degrading monooxygenase HmoA